MARKQMLFIYNPKSGKGELAFNLSLLIERFTKNGYEVTIHPTQGVRDAYAVALERASRYELLVCSGGDGTLCEVIDALMHLENPPLLGYIPSGTTNDFATSLGLPKDVLHAADVVCGGDVFDVDIGKFNDRHFSYVAAFGLFTDVSYDTSQNMKNILGHTAYLLEGVKRLGSIESFRCSITTDKGRLDGDFVFGMVGNSTSVGGFQVPTEQAADLSDGLFEVILLKRPTSFIDLQNVIASLINRERYTDSIIVQKSRQITITPAEPLHWTLDGEDGGIHSEVEVTNLHKALRIIVPHQEQD